MVVKPNYIIKKKEDDIALIISTGEIMDIKNIYAIYNISLPLNGDCGVKEIYSNYFTDQINSEEYIEQEITFSDPFIWDEISRKDDKKKVKYQLSNGNSYEESELIVGSQNIRNFKLNNILGDGIQ